MSIDERLEAIAQIVELLTLDVRELQDTARTILESITRLESTAKQDGENIRALARISEIHERRLTVAPGPWTGMDLLVVPAPGVRKKPSGACLQACAYLRYPSSNTSDQSGRRGSVRKPTMANRRNS